MNREQIKPAVLCFTALTLITGIIYPLFVTAVAQLFFKNQANGSVIFQNSKPVGSTLIGQTFDDPKYLWGRLSATSPVSFNAASSSGSNMGPLNPALIEMVKTRLNALKTSEPDNSKPVPVDLVTSSASGLDPHISLAAAYYQVPRIAQLRKLEQKAVKEIITRNTRSRLLGLIGEPVVNVLMVNIDLDSYKK